MSEIQFLIRSALKHFFPHAMMLVVVVSESEVLLLIMLGKKYFGMIKIAY